MGKAVIAANQSLRVNRAITGATTVNANAYAVVTYQPTSGVQIANVSAMYSAPVFTRYFGPGQAIPASINVSQFYSNNNQLNTGTVTYSLQSGVEFVNSP